MSGRGILIGLGILKWLGIIIFSCFCLVLLEFGERQFISSLPWFLSVLFLALLLAYFSIHLAYTLETVDRKVFQLANVCQFQNASIFFVKIIANSAVLIKPTHFYLLAHWLISSFPPISETGSPLSYSSNSTSLKWMGSRENDSGHLVGFCGWKRTSIWTTLVLFQDLKYSTTLTLFTHLK